MITDQIVPTLSNLSQFARARQAGKRTHVAADKRARLAPAEGRFPSFYYERFLTAGIDFINSNGRSPSLERVVDEVSESKKNSYAAAAAGLRLVVPQLGAVSAKRGKKRIVVLDQAEEAIVSSRVHLEITLLGGKSMWCYLHFGESALMPIERQLTETAVALAAQQSAHVGPVALVELRRGVVSHIDLAAALSAGRIALLRQESEAYLTEWAGVEDI